MTSILQLRRIALCCFLVSLYASEIVCFQNKRTAKAPNNVIIVGGSSGMGKATALCTVIRGGNVLLASRSREKLKKAQDEILLKAREFLKVNEDNDSEIGIGCVETRVLDVTDEEDVKEFGKYLLSLQSSKESESIHYDALVFSAAPKAPHGPITDFATSETRNLFDTKFWGAYNCAKYISPRLRDNGSIVFVSGVLNRRPGINCSPLASVNGALEGLTRSLALELGPRLRVNCLSPGFCDTERFDHMDSEMKKGMLENTADSLPLKRVGQPQDMGEAIYYLLEACFVTGIILDVDGGHHIRQYADKRRDPMRK